MGLSGYISKHSQKFKQKVRMPVFFFFFFKVQVSHALSSPSFPQEKPLEISFLVESLMQILCKHLGREFILETISNYLLYALT